MPRPVCVACQRKMVLDEMGVTVEFQARAAAREPFHLEQGPYQQYRADLYRCPGCNALVAAKYGKEPSWEHHTDYEQRDTRPRVVVMEEP